MWFWRVGSSSLGPFHVELPTAITLFEQTHQDPLSASQLSPTRLRTRNCRRNAAFLLWDHESRGMR